MISLQRILVILDPGLAMTPALERAAALAKATGGQLWIALFAPVPRLAWLDADRSRRRLFEYQIREATTARLHRLADTIRLRHSVTVHVLDHDQAPQAERIAEYVERHGMQVVMKDTVHEPALRRLIFVPLDWELLRICPVPLWLVAPSTCELPQKIAAGVDPLNPEHGAGALNESILATARRIVALAKAELKVFSAFGGLPNASLTLDPLGMGAGWNLGELTERARARHAEAFRDLLESEHIAPGAGQILQGVPTEVLKAAVASYAPDLLVVGTFHRYGFERFVMGSTAEQVVLHAPCDVLAVPAFSRPRVEPDIAAHTVTV